MLRSNTLEETAITKTQTEKSSLETVPPRPNQREPREKKTQNFRAVQSSIGKYQVHITTLVERRANSNEARVHPEWWGDNLNCSRRYSLTPKPNEIEMQYINPVQNKNFITKHHLDDREA